MMFRSSYELFKKVRADNVMTRAVEHQKVTFFNQKQSNFARNLTFFWYFDGLIYGENERKVIDLIHGKYGSFYSQNGTLFSKSVDFCI